MAKSIKAIVKDRNTLIIDEPAETGDFIELDKISKLDTGFINELMESAYKNRLEKELYEKLNEKETYLNEKHQSKIELLKKDFEKNQSEEVKKITEEKQKEIDKLKAENTKLKLDDSTKINELQSKLNAFEDAKKTEIQLKQAEVESKFKDEINSKLNEIDKLKIEIDNLKEQSKKDIENAINNTKNSAKLEYNEEIFNLKSEIEQLKNQKGSYSVKEIGENLEVWCDREVTSFMQNGFLNCKWYKDNKVVKEEDETSGSKADFIFEIYADQNKKADEFITNVCLEMKDEDPASKNKKTNRFYYDKLDKNRKKKNCEFAVLVSLLETDKPNDMLIYKVPEFEKMYVVRPQYLMTFLNLLTSLSNKYCDLVLAKERENEEFLAQDTFKEEFAKLVNTYLDKPLESLKKEVETIGNATQKIIDSANEIKKCITNITDKYVNEIKKKLDNFDIKINKEYKKFNKAMENK